MNDRPNLRIDLASDGRLFVAPSAGERLRPVERALRAAILPIELDAVAGGAFVDVADFEACREALASWSIQLGAGVADAVQTRAHRRASHERALAAQQALAAEEDVGRKWLAGYERLGDLDDHQVSAVALAAHADVEGLCIFDEQGLGKTVEALFAFDRLRQQGLVGRALVFAPKNMVLEWVNDLTRFFPGAYQAAAVVGDESEKRRILDGKADVYVSNFETAIQLETRLRQLLQGEHGRALLVVDESFFVKNADAERAKAIRRLRRYAGRCIVLCGTPAPNSALDLIEQFNIADDGEAFRSVSIPKEPTDARAIIGETIETRGVYLRRLKTTVMPHLPDRTFNRVLLPMPPQQRALYDGVLNGLIEDVRNATQEEFARNLTTFMARRSALLQLCSNPKAIDGSYSETSAKVLALDDILADLIVGKNEKVVLWSFYTASLDAQFKRYAAYKPVRIDGTITDVADRREAVRRFQEDDETKLFIGNPAAAGAGLTLHRARYGVYESMSNQAAHYLQSLDRIHRRGQDRPVEYIILLCDETLELQEYDRLLRKEADAQDLLGDEIRPPQTKEGFLADLLGAAGKDLAKA